jgi:hypothetical protein
LVDRRRYPRGGRQRWSGIVGTNGVLEGHVDDGREPLRSERAASGPVRACADMLAETRAAGARCGKQLGILRTAANRAQHRVALQGCSGALVSPDGFAQQRHGSCCVAAEREIGRPQVERLGILPHGEQDPHIVIAQPILSVWCRA